MENNVLNFNEILKNCGVYENQPADAISKIAGLEEFYNENELIKIFNYILEQVQNPEILNGVIKLTAAHRDEGTLLILLKILLTNTETQENSEDFVNLRVTCAKEISQYKNPSTLDSLLKCLNNKNENYKVRLACADALGRIGDKYAVNTLINVVKDEEEKSIYVKESATFALGLIGDTSAIDPLVSIMEAKQGIWDKFSFLKEKIIEALGKLSLNNDKVLKVYKDSLMDASPMVRINTIEALMNSEYNEAPELIRTALHDENEEVQQNALIALYNIYGRDILEEIISLPVYSEFLKTEAKNLINEYEKEEEDDE